MSHQGHYVYLLAPSRAEFLLSDQSDHPQPDPLKDRQQQEASRESTYAGCRSASRLSTTGRRKRLRIGNSPTIIGVF